MPYNESQGVKTFRDSDFATRIVDWKSTGTATRGATAGKDGDLIVPGTNDFGLSILVKGSDGNLHLPKCDAAGNLMVVEGLPSGAGRVAVQTKSAAVANGAPVNIDTVITSGKVVNSLSVDSVCSQGLFLFQIGLWDGVSVFTLYGAAITSPASPTARFSLPNMPTGDGTVKIRLIVTNLDLTANDAYSSISWVEE